METLYDVLGARPGDDAESLKNAYHKAAKANHPDRHAGDPEAAMRFRRIATAYDILRDTKRRAAYDRLLDDQRGTLRSRARRAISHPAYQFVAGGVVGFVLASGGYLLFVGIHGISGDHAGRTATGQQPRMVAVEAAKRAGTSKAETPVRAAQMPVVKPVLHGAAALAAEGKGALEAAQGPSASAAANQTTGRSVSPIDPAGPKSAASDSGKDSGAEPEQHQSAESRTTALAQHEICKRDAAQLAQLRMSQGRDEVIRFERELGCEKLRPQVIRLRESVDPR